MNATGVVDPMAVAFTLVDLARKSFARANQRVLDEHILAGERLQETRLAGVRVAHQRRRRHIPPALALIGAMLGDVLEPFLEHRDFAANGAAVGFELRFARAPEAGTAADTR